MKVKKFKCHLLQFLSDALRVNNFQWLCRLCLATFPCLEKIANFLKKEGNLAGQKNVLPRGDGVESIVLKEKH